MTNVTVDLADALRAIPYLASLDRAQRIEVVRGLEEVSAWRSC